MSKIEHAMAEMPDKPNYDLKKTVVLVGLMGAGKTAVGRALALALGVPFLDSDNEIEVAANMSVPEIFARDGEPFFRDRESQVISRLLDSQKCVLSTGGGAFMSPLNQQNIHNKGVSVWLNGDIDLLWSRVKHRDTRPLLRTSNPLQTLTDLYHARVPQYQKADLHVNCAPSVSIEMMAERVVQKLLTRPDVLEPRHD